MDTIDDSATLKQDATLAAPLRRVSYEAGMMLGLEATRDEQAYHRRRLNRHQYWFDGYGTLAGMRVSMSPETHANRNDVVLVRLMVSPGIGIDGLGREVLLHETYCIDLGQWLAAQGETQLRGGYDDAGDALWLAVYIRQRDCPVAQQPVLARKLNLSTDAVQPSRIADSVLLELVPELPPEEAEPRFQPWACHRQVTESLPTLSAAEQVTLQEVTTENAAAGAQLALGARLLHALNADGVSVKNLNEQFEAGARLLLARVSIEVTDLNAVVINPRRISINNLVRPFLVSASQLAWLARQP
jgi:hypothetical protein